MTSSTTAFSFLTALYGEDAPAFLSLFFLPSKRVLWQPASNIRELLQHAQPFLDTEDVYFGLGLRDKPPHGRGTEDSIRGIPGLWCDLDIADPVHKARGLPPSIEAVEALLPLACPCAPSVIVHSGHGLQAYWLFRELWLFDAAEERTAAKALCQRLQASLQAVAHERGWHIDSTFDLARVFRLPGTINHKAAPIPVETRVWALDHRYSPSELDELLPILDTPSAPPADVREGDAIPSLAELRISVRMKYLLRVGEDPNDPQRYASRSEAEFAVMTALIAGGYAESQIKALLLNPAYALSEKPRERGEGWLTQEIRRARQKYVPASEGPAQGQGSAPPREPPEGRILEPHETLDTLLHVLYHTRPGLHTWLDLRTIAMLAPLYETAQWDECLAQADQQFKGGGFRVKAAVERWRAEHRHGAGIGLPPLETYTALQADTIHPPTQLFEGLLHEGMLLFGGKSKRGKSWLIYDLALALATGHAGFRHYACPQRLPVLYLALEDGRARLQRRGREILPGVTTVDNFHLRYSFPPLTEGGIELLEQEIATHHYGLVIIDVLAKVEPPKAGKGDKNYHDIYDMFTPLQALREKHPFCLAMLTHLRKQEADDAFDALLGSVAYQAAQDVLWVLERKPKDDYAFLHIRDKDADEATIALRFLDGHWEYMGEGEEYEMSRDQRKVMTVLAEEKKEMSIPEILKAASFKEEKYGYLRKLLMTMVKEDIIHRTRHGKYSATIRGALDFSDAPSVRYPGMEEEEDLRFH